MFLTPKPEIPAWLLSLLAIAAGVALIAFGDAVPGVIQAVALAGIVAAVGLTDNATPSIFPWVIVGAALVGIVILAGLGDALPQWLEAVGVIAGVGGSSLAVPSSSKIVAPVTVAPAAPFVPVPAVPAPVAPVIPVAPAVAHPGVVGP